VDTAERSPAAELRRQLGDSFHRQHLEATARLLASVAHDVRSALASIVYSADFLDERGTHIGEEVLRATVHDIGAAARRLQLTVDSLLDYARLGPVISVPVSLRDVLSRAQGLLRSFFRDGAHGLRIEIGEGAEWVRGNPVVVEQIFVNLLLSAAECAEAPSQFTVRARSAPPPAAEGSGTLVQVRIVGDCPLFACHVADAAPDAQAAAWQDGLRLALADAEAAAAVQGGELTCERGADGLCFVVRLPRSEGPR
jgi:signal transduction histidine kinase